MEQRSCLISIAIPLCLNKNYIQRKEFVYCMFKNNLYFLLFPTLSNSNIERYTFQELLLFSHQMHYFRMDLHQNCVYVSGKMCICM